MTLPVNFDTSKFTFVQSLDTIVLPSISSELPSSKSKINFMETSELAESIVVNWVSFSIFKSELNNFISLGVLDYIC